MSDYTTVLAVPYDMPCVGYDVDNVVNTLRLWSARAPKRIDMEYFNQGDYVRAMEERNLAEVISKVLYPEDNHYEGTRAAPEAAVFLLRPLPCSMPCNDYHKSTMEPI